MPALRLPFDRSVARRMALVALSIVLGFVVLEFGVAKLMADRRADERVSDYNALSPTVPNGGSIGLLQIEKIGLDAVIAEGANPSVLRGGPGLHPDSPMPGEGGNTVLLGHRRRFDATFARLGELVPGDVLIAQTRGGVPIRYVVEEAGVVSRSEAERRASRVGDRLTLVTSDDGYISFDRFVVNAVAEGSGAAAASDGRGIRLGGPGVDDLLTVSLWIAAFVGLLLFGRRLTVARARPLAIVMLPLVAFAALELFLAFDRLVPSTL